MISLHNTFEEIVFKVVLGTWGYCVEGMELFTEMVFKYDYKETKLEDHRW